MTPEARAAKIAEIREQRQALVAHGHRFGADEEYWHRLASSYGSELDILRPLLTAADSQIAAETKRADENDAKYQESFAFYEDARKQITQLQGELDGTRQPPDNQCWVDLVAWAYQHGGGALSINRITAEYNSIKAERDRLAGEVDRHIISFRSVEASLGTLDHSEAINDEKALPDWTSRKVAQVVSQLAEHAARWGKLREGIGILLLTYNKDGRLASNRACLAIQDALALIDSLSKPAEPNGKAREPLASCGWCRRPLVPEKMLQHFTECPERPMEA